MNKWKNFDYKNEGEFCQVLPTELTAKAPQRFGRQHQEDLWLR